MSEFMRALLDPAPLVLDGGMGSMLLAAGLSPGQPPEAWVQEHPQRVLAVHRAYVDAGAAAVHTCTFGATPLRLEAVSLAGACAKINRAAVNLARQSGAPFVIADVGPTGDYLPPVGHADPQAWYESFVQQGQALVAAGVDACHIETMSDLREAEVALNALRAIAPTLPIMVSLTFERKPRGFFTIMGDTPAAAATALRRAGSTAVGANCSITSAEMIDLARELVAVAALPVVVQPNAGQPQSSPTGLHYAQRPEAFAEQMVAAARVGVAALGGCCGTDPSFIAALRAGLAAELTP